MTDRTPLQLFLSSAPTGAIIMDQHPNTFIEAGHANSRFGALKQLRMVTHNDGEPDNFRFWPLITEGTPTRELDKQFQKPPNNLAFHVYRYLAHRAAAWPIPHTGTPFSPFGRRILNLFVQEKMARDPIMVAELAGLDDEQLGIATTYARQDLDPKGTIFVPTDKLILLNEGENPTGSGPEDDIAGLETLANMYREIEGLITMHPPANPLHVNMINLRAHLKDALRKLVIQ